MTNIKEGDTIGALELRLKMFDKYNEYSGNGNYFQTPSDESQLV